MGEASFPLEGSNTPIVGPADAYKHPTVEFYRCEQMPHNRDKEKVMFPSKKLKIANLWVSK